MYEDKVTTLINEGFQRGERVNPRPDSNSAGEAAKHYLRNIERTHNECDRPGECGGRRYGELPRLASVWDD
jgi:hypothetical protein